MAFSTQALNAEFTTDPLNMGYAPLVNSGSDDQLAHLLNSLTSPGAASISAGVVDKNYFLLQSAPALFVLPTLSQALQNKWYPILNTIGNADKVDTGTAEVQGMLALAVNDGVLTQAQVTAITTRLGSRAEVLFGAGTAVTAYQCSQSR